jgi:hypothetical protein
MYDLILWTILTPILGYMLFLALAPSKHVAKPKKKATPPTNASGETLYEFAGKLMTMAEITAIAYQLRKKGVVK